MQSKPKVKLFPTPVGAEMKNSLLDRKASMVFL
jgi:hypothetical protein